MAEHEAFTVLTPENTAIVNMHGQAGRFGDGAYVQAEVMTHNCPKCICHALLMFARQHGIADLREVGYSVRNG